MKLTVVLNGTAENPYHKLGLKCNPFSQLAKTELDPFVMRIQSLGRIRFQIGTTFVRD